MWALYVRPHGHSKLRSSFADGESATFQRIQHVRRQSGDPLQILPGLEGTILKTMLHDLLGIVFTDALNDSQFLFSSFIQIHVFQDNISFRYKLLLQLVLISKPLARSVNR